MTSPQFYLFLFHFLDAYKDRIVGFGPSFYWIPFCAVERTLRLENINHYVLRDTLCSFLIVKFVSQMGGRSQKIGRQKMDQGIARHERGRGLGHAVDDASKLMVMMTVTDYLSLFLGCQKHLMGGYKDQALAYPLNFFFVIWEFCDFCSCCSYRHTCLVLLCHS